MEKVFHPVSSLVSRTLLLHLLVILADCCERAVERTRPSSRPFYVIGHMANSFYDIQSFLDEGANGIESDVTFDEHGTPTVVYHGFPCDCWRYCFWKVDFAQYLDYVRIVNTPADFSTRPGLALLYLDLKVSYLSNEALVKAGQNLAKLIHMHLFSYENEYVETFRSPWILLGVPDVPHLLVFQHFRETFRKLGLEHLLNRIGYDVYVSAHDTKAVLRACQDANITGNIWLSSGLTNCFPPDYSLLERILKMKDDGLRADGVYHWTIDAKHNIRKSLNLGVDGIVTNSPENVLGILDERKFSRWYRLANINDVPWGKHQP